MPLFFMAIKVDGTAVAGFAAGWPDDQVLNPLDEQPTYVFSDDLTTAEPPAEAAPTAATTK